MTIADTNTIVALTTGAAPRWVSPAAWSRPGEFVRCRPRINPRFVSRWSASTPYQEHDFGAFEYAGERIVWKIDYYDRTLRRGSDDPSGPFRTVRVLTIMLASEY